MYRWLPEALNFVGQFRCIVPLAALRSTVPSGIMKSSAEGELHIEDYHRVLEHYTGHVSVLLMHKA